MIAITSLRLVVVFGTTIGDGLTVVVALVLLVVVLVVAAFALEIQTRSPIIIFVEVLALLSERTFLNEISKRAAIRVHESFALALWKELQVAARAGVGKKILTDNTEHNVQNKTNWRRGWDLNPRSGLPGQRLSRAPHSAALAPLQNLLASFLASLLTTFLTSLFNMRLLSVRSN